MFLDMMGSYNSLRIKRSFVKANPNTQLPASMAQQIVDADGQVFCAWVLTAINNMGRHGKRQMFFISFTATFHGLARMGMSILSNYGFMMKKTMYDYTREALLLEYKDLTR